MRHRQAGVGRRIVRVQGDGTVEHLGALPQIARRHPRQALPAAQVVLVGHRPGLRPRQCLLLPLAQRVASQRGRYVVCDLGLDREHLLERAIEALRPAVMARGHLHQLHGDPQVIVRLAHAAFEQCPHSQRPPDLAHVRTRAAVLEGGRSRRHAQAFDLRQRVDQLLRQPLAEVILIAPRAHVGERQHRNRGKLFHRRCLEGWRRGLRPRHVARQRRDELVALAVARLDVLRLLRVIGQRLAQLLDARRQRIVTGNGIGPDGGEEGLLLDRRAGVRDQHLQHG